ncbi:hypothetical protein SUGI_0300610 [Cryptomeria japonica]|uniref:protein LEAD-SENSITIVE 1-like n=1 Tax=Cryptomeria japonica TaxID=3369 RepID=UPI002408EA44|nr:protein LEAD-SENSITIVE 1-like [Cryptomeria japonica]GLJ17313.1 hypothetical protein SUGI_0300610 [Cryptomeria japonica]
MGSAYSVPIHVEMNITEISPGDHIYTSRSLYDHHGIYIGEDLDLVIHFQNSVGDKLLGSSIHRFDQCPDCGHHSGRSGVVLISCLNCFLRDGKIYRYQYGYRTQYWRKILWELTRFPRLLKCCTSFTSDPPEIVIGRAKELLTDGFGDYNLVTNNCEDFALLCKTGNHIQGGQIRLLVLRSRCSSI